MKAADWTFTKFIPDAEEAQFPSKGLREYMEWVEGTEEPTGICPNCGEYCYEGRYICSDRCEREYVAYCSRPL